MGGCFTSSPQGHRSPSVPSQGKAGGPHRLFQPCVLTLAQGRRWPSKGYIHVTALPWPLGRAGFQERATAGRYTVAAWRGAIGASSSSLWTGLARQQEPYRLGGTGGADKVRWPRGLKDLFQPGPWGTCRPSQSLGNDPDIVL